MGNVTRTFPKKDIWDGWWDPAVEIIEDEIFETSRWSEHHRVVFKYGDKHYRTAYSQGLTEYQDETPFEYQETIEATEVHQVERVVKVWAAVQDG